tara:strand:+ start:42 stop:317 length:276 start_codon:yes stop_codon:yes gene_type:complete
MNEKEKMPPDEASDKGGDILFHLIKIYDQIDWGDSEGEFVRVSMFKNKSMSIINHKDVAMGAAPTTFTLSEDGEWDVDNSGEHLPKDSNEV